MSGPRMVGPVRVRRTRRSDRERRARERAKRRSDATAG
jgi:hypothetical protein